MNIVNYRVFSIVFFAALCYVFVSCKAHTMHHTVRYKEYNEGSRYRTYTNNLPAEVLKNDTLYFKEFAICRAESVGMFGSYSPVAFNQDSIIQIFMTALKSIDLPISISDKPEPINTQAQLCELPGKPNYYKRAKFHERIRFENDNIYYILPVLNLRGGTSEVQPYTSAVGMREIWYSYGYTLNLIIIRNKQEIFRSNSYFYKNSLDSMGVVHLDQENWQLFVELAFTDLLKSLED